MALLSVYSVHVFANFFRFRVNPVAGNGIYASPDIISPFISLLSNILAALNLILRRYEDNLMYTKDRFRKTSLRHLGNRRKIIFFVLLLKWSSFSSKKYCNLDDLCQ